MGLAEHHILRDIVLYRILVIFKNTLNVFVPFGKIKHDLLKKIFSFRVRQVDDAANDFSYAMFAIGNMKAGYNTGCISKNFFLFSFNFWLQIVFCIHIK